MEIVPEVPDPWKEVTTIYNSLTELMLDKL